MAIERAHTVIISAQGDSAEELADMLHSLAHDLERGQMTVGVIGGSSAGAMYSYRINPEQTHDRYFQQIGEQLKAEKAKRQETAA